MGTRLGSCKMTRRPICSPEFKLTWSYITRPRGTIKGAFCVPPLLFWRWYNMPANRPGLYPTDPNFPIGTNECFIYIYTYSRTQTCLRIFSVVLSLCGYSGSKQNIARTIVASVYIFHGIVDGMIASCSTADVVFLQCGASRNARFIYIYICYRLR
jgi:hypothetical protein